MGEVWGSITELSYVPILKGERTDILNRRNDHGAPIGSRRAEGRPTPASDIISERIERVSNGHCYDLVHHMDIVEALEVSPRARAGGREIRQSGTRGSRRTTPTLLYVGSLQRLLAVILEQKNTRIGIVEMWEGEACLIQRENRKRGNTVRRLALENSQHPRSHVEGRRQCSR
ncbi:hypothetical protein BV22DRAFT_803417 [Leucogyrophana mollusca]|uniref:Uncharacterized protein n=1 Tax=Leucogyrophana mollusca TaxID=85980 RepID=A0ACB8B4H6_9AGAM|nr:hypothetical protein BV22DRAFT_803417 [Leucogyrophana mollusca]